MTEIEKIYEKAGIKKCNRRLLPCPFNNECDEGCEYHWYPGFSEEKQIELIKLLGKRASISLDIFSDNETWFYSDYGIDGCFEYRADGETFDEALAGIVNVLWKILDNQEKEEVRKILNEKS